MENKSINFKKQKKTKIFYKLRRFKTHSSNILVIPNHQIKEMSSQDLLTLFLYTFLASIFFFLFFIKKRTNSKPSKSKKLPPGPPKLPIIGNLHQMKQPLHRTLHDLSQKYGDLMLLQLGTIPALVISSADMAKEVIKNFDTTFGGRPRRFAIDMSTYGGTDIVFAPYGEYWKEVRKIAVMELLSPKKVLSFAAVRVDEVALLLQTIARSSPGQPLDLTNLLHQLSNNVLCRVAFGRAYEGESNKSPLKLLEENQFLIGTISVPDFFPKMAWLNKVNGFEKRVKKNCMELDELYEVVIREHLDPNRSDSDHEDLVDVLLRLQTKPSLADNNLIKALISDMFVAGTDTTSSTLIWTMTELMRNPSTMKRAQEEVRGKVIGKEQVEESDLQGLTYMKALIKETFRLHSPTPLLIPRETMAECEVNGYYIPAKTTVFINYHSMAMDTKSWENPSEFRPERFLDSTVDYKGQHYELIPFGAGRRICPGMNFATAVVELVLANLLYCFDWELPKGMRPEDVDVEESVGIVVNPKTPLYLVATPASVRKD